MNTHGTPTQKRKRQRFPKRGSVRCARGMKARTTTVVNPRGGAVSRPEGGGVRSRSHRRAQPDRSWIREKNRPGKNPRGGGSARPAHRERAQKKKPGPARIGARPAGGKSHRRQQVIQQARQYLLSFFFPRMLFIAGIFISRNCPRTTIGAEPAELFFYRRAFTHAGQWKVLVGVCAVHWYIHFWPVHPSEIGKRTAR